MTTLYLIACLIQLDTDDVTVENSMGKSFDQIIKMQLDPIWNQLVCMIMIGTYRSVSPCTCPCTYLPEVSMYMPMYMPVMSMYVPAYPCTCPCMCLRFHVYACDICL